MTINDFTLVIDFLKILLKLTLTKEAEASAIRSKIIDRMVQSLK